MISGVSLVFRCHWVFFHDIQRIHIVFCDSVKWNRTIQTQTVVKIVYLCYTQIQTTIQHLYYYHVTAFRNMQAQSYHWLSVTDTRVGTITTRILVLSIILNMTLLNTLYWSTIGVAVFQYSYSCVHYSPQPRLIQLRMYKERSS